MTKEEVAAYDKAYYQTNKEKISIRNKAWYQANKEEVAASNKAYYKANKETLAVKNKAYREANKENIANYDKAYYKANKEMLTAKKKAYREANKEKIDAKIKAWYKNAKEKKLRITDYLVKKYGKTPCMDCDKVFDWCVMDFDHRPKEAKEFAIGKVGNIKATPHAIAKIEKEIAKCDLVCSNCHRVRTWITRQQDE
jgi:hypothetical protein